MQKIFEALASPLRRSILAYLSKAELNAGEIAERFDVSKPTISQHLTVLEDAGLIASERRGKFIYYRQIEANLVNTLSGFLMEVCPVARPLKRESRVLAGRAVLEEDQSRSNGEAEPTD
jgi:ArsR family transcriptional regulator